MIEINTNIIFLAVIFFCFFSFAIGFGLAFFVLARDKNLVKLQENQVLVDKNFFDQLMATQRRGGRYDGKIMPEED